MAYAAKCAFLRVKKENTLGLHDFIVDETLFQINAWYDRLNIDSYFNKILKSLGFKTRSPTVTFKISVEHLLKLKDRLIDPKLRCSCVTCIKSAKEQLSFVQESIREAILFLGKGYSIYYYSEYKTGDLRPFKL